MIAHHIHDALAQVRQLQHVVIERLRFKGFSGPTRAVSGLLALLMAAALSSSLYPKTTEAHLVGWISVLGVSLLLNAGALLYWFWTDPIVNRDIRRLGPVLDIIPPLTVGALLTAVFILHGLHRYLFGIWMCMFGLSNLASRYVLPGSICIVGIFYIGCGTLWLLAPGVSFLNPWPMGVVFCAGEWVGGMILHFDHRRLHLSRHGQQAMNMEEPSHVEE